jgi:hypothetical protein
LLQLEILRAAAHGPPAEQFKETITLGGVAESLLWGFRDATQSKETRYGNVH